MWHLLPSYPNPLTSDPTFPSRTVSPAENQRINETIARYASSWWRLPDLAATVPWAAHKPSQNLNESGNQQPADNQQPRESMLPSDRPRRDRISLPISVQSVQSLSNLCPISVPACDARPTSSVSSVRCAADISSADVFRSFPKVRSSPEDISSADSNVKGAGSHSHAERRDGVDSRPSRSKLARFGGIDAVGSSFTTLLRSTFTSQPTETTGCRRRADLQNSPIPMPAPYIVDF
jgi:hypothetical protein